MNPKLRFWAAAIFALGSACVTLTAHANGIDLLSCSLETHGNWSEQWFIGDDPENPDESYSAAGNFSFHAAGIGAASTTVVSSPHNWERAASTITALGLSMRSSSAPSDDGNFVEGEINIYSTARTQFRVSQPRLLISVNGDVDYNYEDWEQAMGVTLRDASTGLTLIDLPNLVNYGGEIFSYDYSFAVDQSHLYELELYGRINSWDAKYVEMSSTLRMASVPDSGSTFALASVALLSLAFFRTRC